MKKSFLWMLSVSLVAVAGCSVMGVGKSEFQCGEDGAPKCDSVMKTYQKTNSAKMREREIKSPAELVSTIPAMGAAIDPASWPKPVLEPAQVVRVWIAPWTDNKEILHWPSYVFAEVKARKWSFGQPDFRNVKQLVPLQVERRSTVEQPGANQDPPRP